MSIPQSMATITDGSSNTAAASEQLLGTSTTHSVLADTTAVGYPPGLRPRPFGRADSGRLCRGRHGWELDKGAGLTHHNSEAGLYGKFRIPNKLKLLPYSPATFR